MAPAPTPVPLLPPPRVLLLRDASPSAWQLLLALLVFWGGPVSFLGFVLLLVRPGHVCP